MTARVFCLLSAVLLCLSACLSTTDAGVVAAKPGQCPSKASGVKKCGELCAYDRDCPNNEKCCSNGCGHQCMPPYTVKPAAEPPKPPLCGGSCLQPPYRGDGHSGNGRGRGRGHGKGRGHGHDCD